MQPQHYVYLAALAVFLVVVWILRDRLTKGKVSRSGFELEADRPGPSAGVDVGVVKSKGDASIISNHPDAGARVGEVDSGGKAEIKHDVPKANSPKE